MSYKVLLVDDEPDILEFLSYNLQKNNFKVKTALSGDSAIETAIVFKPDLIILDVMMPKMDGIETCKRLREMKEFSQTIIVFLTARAEDYSQIAGLDAGADDYIAKPIKPSVFLSKVNSICRRLAYEKQTPVAESSLLQIDKEGYLVIHKSKEVHLPKKEFELIDLLSSKKGKVFTRDEILSKVWGNDVVVGDRTIDVHIRKLREKFGSSIIKTIKGVGYKLEL